MRNIQLTEAQHSWLTGLIERAKAQAYKAPHAYAPEIFEHIIGVMKALEDAETEKVEAEPEPVKKQRKPRQPKEAPIPRRNGCTEHPAFEAQRAPRRDCKGCWGLYRHLHPTQYPLARKKFERRMAAGA